MNKIDIDGSKLLRIICIIVSIIIFIVFVIKQIFSNDMITQGKEMYQSFNVALENDSGSNISDFTTMIQEGNIDDLEKSLNNILE